MAAETSRLRNTLLAIVTPVALLVVAGGGYLADRLIEVELERTASERLLATASRGAQLVERFLADSRADLAALAANPSVVAAARSAGAQAARQGLDRLSIEALEQRFTATRVLTSNPVLTRYLESFQQGSDLAELFFTDVHGFNVAATNITSDFVQSDETWWQDANANGAFTGVPEYDESAGVVAIELAVRITDPTGGGSLGVVKGLLRLSRLAGILRAGDNGDITVEAVDAGGRILVGPDTTRLLRVGAEQATIRRETEPVVETVAVPGGDQLVATVPTNRGTWWLVARQPTDAAFAVVASVRRIILGSILAAVLLTVGAMAFLARWLTRSVTRPVRAAAAVAGRVAGGDLTVDVRTDATTQADAAELLLAIRGMVGELRALVNGIRGSAEELAAMAQQISASTEEMSASTEEMAATSQRLTDQSARQADEVRRAAQEAKQILTIATHLADGARLASDRSSQLKGTAEQHRAQLLAGSEQLAGLANEIAEGAAEAGTLAELSTEVQKFVTQTKAIATRTNMLALNAAIEAARAGGEGRGFAVVAEEVRKLAGQAAGAAQATTETVGRVLNGVGRARDRFQRLADESAAVREIADTAAQGLSAVTDQAAENSAWAEEISGAAGEARQLVEEISQRLQTIAESTENFVAAVEQIAASAEEQSASTEEIASSAAQLAVASEKLNSGVSRFRLFAGTKGD